MKLSKNSLGNRTKWVKSRWVTEQNEKKDKKIIGCVNQTKWEKWLKTRQKWAETTQKSLHNNIKWVKRPKISKIDSNERVEKNMLKTHTTIKGKDTKIEEKYTNKPFEHRLLH